VSDSFVIGEGLAGGETVRVSISRLVSTGDAQFVVRIKVGESSRKREERGRKGLAHHLLLEHSGGKLFKVKLR